MQFYNAAKNAAPSKPKNLKLNNRRAILELMRRSGEISVSAIAQTTDISRTTVMKCLQYFLQKGLAQSCGKGESSLEGGKRPEIYAFKADSGFICTLCIQDDRLICAISDLSGRQRARLRLSHSPNESLRIMLENIPVLIMSAVDKSRISVGQLRGIIACIDGIVDTGAGVVCQATHFPGWGRDVQLAELIRISLGRDIPTAVETTVRMLGLAELIANPRLCEKTVVTFFGDLGVSACVMRGGELIRGRHAFLGELGHMITDSASKESCYCGSKGCCQLAIAAPRVLVKVRREHGQWPESRIYEKTESGELAFDDIFAAADAGDSFARCTVDCIVRNFAIVLHNTILSHDPDVILLQGCYANTGAYFLKQLRQRVDAMQLAGFGETASIRCSSLNVADARISAPAHYMLERVFADDRLYEQ